MPARTQKSEYKGTTYAEAVAFLGKRQSVKIANNTWLERLVWEGEDSGLIGVRLHRTYVVIYYTNGTVAIDNGGWYTQTTARRIDQFTRIQVSFSKPGNRVYYRNPHYESGQSYFDHDNPIEFTEGMILNESGYAHD